MARKKKIIITNNKEIYNKFNMLHFSSEVILKGVKPVQVNKIIKNINKNGNFLTSEKLGDYILIKKNLPVNYDIYLK